MSIFGESTDPPLASFGDFLNEVHPLFIIGFVLLALFLLTRAFAR